MFDLEFTFKMVPSVIIWSLASGKSSLGKDENTEALWP